MLYFGKFVIEVGLVAGGYGFVVGSGGEGMGLLLWVILGVGFMRWLISDDFLGFG